MEWHDILKNKKQIKYFSKDKVSKKIIVEILDELHRYCPSKQNLTPYTITVISQKNKQKQKDIYFNSWCVTDHIKDTRNAQVIAPYIFLFQPTTNDRISMIEIGIAALFLSYSAVNKGLGVAFCECYKGNDAVLIVSVGYCEHSNRYYNPLYKRYAKKMEEGDTQSKQDKTNYIIWT